MKLLFYILIICSFNACAQKKESIRQFFPYYLVHDSVKKYDELGFVKEESFIISNYKGSQETDKLVDSFILANRDKKYARFDTYFMNFYKESSYTNEAHLAETPRDIDRYSNRHDCVYIYTWNKGKFFERRKMRDGEVIEPKNYSNGITVTNAKDSVK